ncbi:hypothetical protein GCM10010533_26540 [Mycolicibacterium pallens]
MEGVLHLLDGDEHRSVFGQEIRGVPSRDDGQRSDEEVQGPGKNEPSSDDEQWVANNDPTQAREELMC